MFESASKVRDRAHLGPTLDRSVDVVEGLQHRQVRTRPELAVEVAHVIIDVFPVMETEDPVIT